jgi:hypothetical protein
MTKQIFEVINPIRIRSASLPSLSGITDKRGGMDMTEFEPSKLGTRVQYARQLTLKKLIFTSHSWDDVYVREVANFEETGDEGEIW